MAKKVETFTISIETKGLKDLTGLQRQLKNLERVAKPVDGSFKLLTRSIKDVSKFTPRTISQFKQKERTLKALREEVKAGGIAFKRLGREIEANRKKLQKFNNTAKKGTGLNKLGTGFGSLIASQVLPGNTSQLALAGANIAGPKGAAVGAVIGAGMDFAGFARSASQYSAQIKRLEVALKGVTKSQIEFNKAQAVIQSVSKELNVPIANATQQFTTLTASVIGAGGSVDEAEKVFRGVSEAIKATGGDAEDVKSAIRAMSQIFGKGKVSAEELQGQLGERLPGAVTKFALATNRTLPQLQKDLRDGTVGLNDVMKFVEKLSEDHAEAAKAMAKSSADAGQRMQVTFDELKKNVGDIFQPLGAEIQDVVEMSLDNINRLIGGIRKLMKVGDEFELENLIRERDRLEKGAAKFGFSDILDAISDPTGISLFTEFGEIFASKEFKDMKKKQLELINQQIKEKQQRDLMMRQIKAGLTLDKDFGSSAFGLGFNVFATDEKAGSVFQDPVSQAAENDTKKARDILEKYAESVKNINQQIASSFVSTFKKLEDSLVEFLTTGTLNFRKFAQSIIQEITRIFIRSQIIKPLTGIFGNMFSGSGSDKGSSFIIPDTSLTGIDSSLFLGGTNAFKQNAKGNVFAKNKIVPYAMGGIVNKPTLFPMRNGMGLMGEAGPEAVIPLKRGRDGKLGVQASGGIGNIVVNVDASGSSVEGNSSESVELGKMLGAVVQAELIKQKRPGGLLS